MSSNLTTGSNKHEESMKRIKPKIEKIKYQRKIARTREAIPGEQTIPDKTKYDRKENKQVIEKEMEND